MNRKNKLHNVLLWLDVFGRGTVSCIFLLAAVPKLFDVHGFAFVIGAYALLPDVFLLPTAVTLPVMEIILAVGLLFNRWQCKVGITVVLLCFIVLLTYSIGQGLDIDCGCFGPEDPEHAAFQGLRQALVRDMIMLVPLIYSFWFHRDCRLKTLY